MKEKPLSFFIQESKTVQYGFLNKMFYFYFQFYNNSNAKIIA